MIHANHVTDYSWQYSNTLEVWYPRDIPNFLTKEKLQLYGKKIASCSN